MKFKMLVEKLNASQLDALFADVDRQRKNPQRIKSREERIADTMEVLKQHQKEREARIKEFRNEPGVKYAESGYRQRDMTYYVGTTSFSASAYYNSEFDTSLGNNDMYSVYVYEDGKALYSNTMSEKDAKRFIREVAEARFEKGEPLTTREIEKLY